MTPMDARRRLEKMRRLIDVQERLCRMAEAKLADIERRQAELSRAQTDILASLNADEPLHGMFVETMARHLHRLACHAAELEEARRSQAQLVLNEAMKLKRVERYTARVARVSREQEDKRSLAEILDAPQARATQA